MLSTSDPVNQQSSRQLTGITVVALAGIAYFAVVIVALHVLRSDSDPIGQTTSHYAIGSYGFLMTTAFLSVGLASLALIAGIYYAVVPLARSQPGLGLLGVWAVCVLIAMIFPIDPADTPQTASGTIHRIAGPLAFLSLSAGAILVSWKMKYDDRWQSMRQVALPVAVFMLAAFVVTGLNIALDSGFQGLFQRIVLVTFVMWFILMATRLGSIARETEPNGTDQASDII